MNMDKKLYYIGLNYKKGRSIKYTNAIITGKYDILELEIKDSKTNYIYSKYGGDLLDNDITTITMKLNSINSHNVNLMVNNMIVYNEPNLFSVCLIINKDVKVELIENIVY